MAKIIQVYAPGMEARVQTEEERIEAISGRPLQKKARAAIDALDFSPAAVNQLRGFEPGETTALFESQVSAPDLSNPKFRYIPSWVRRLATRMFPLFSLMTEKIMENKVQAFYHVVHELVALNYRYQKLEKDYELLQGEVAEMRRVIAEYGLQISQNPESPGRGKA